RYGDQAEPAAERSGERPQHAGEGGEEGQREERDRRREPEGNALLVDDERIADGRHGQMAKRRAERHGGGEERGVDGGQEGHAFHEGEACEEGLMRGPAGERDREEPERRPGEREGQNGPPLAIEEEDEHEGGGRQLDRGGEGEGDAGRNGTVRAQPLEGEERQEAHGDRRLVLPDREMRL